MRRAPRYLAALVALFTLGLAACGSGGERPSLSNTTAPASVTAAPATSPGPNTIPAGSNYIAQATVPVVKVYDTPSAGASSREFTNPWFVNEDERYPVNLVFLADEQRGDWVKVLLPVRPNGSEGWIRASDVHLSPSQYRIEIDLSNHKLVVYDRDHVYLEDTVAIGKASTPTPVGRFYLRILLKAPDPTTVYGPYAYGLSSHSETLTEFNGGDAEVGIHGNNDASVLGQNVSSGCIRMDNEKITQLSQVLPLGTPVEIRA